MDTTRLIPDPATHADSELHLEAWDAEGGALAGTVPVVADPCTALSTAERRLLGLLGAALLGEWNRLPMPLRRALYDRAVRGNATSDPAVLKRRMARFLHDRKDPDQPSMRP